MAGHRKAVERARRRALLRTRLDAARRPRADEGFAMSSSVALMCGAAVVLAGIGFVVTDREPPAQEQAMPVTAVQPAQPRQRPVDLEQVKAKPEVKRQAVYIDVYNNSNVTGLAARTAQQVTDRGWQVVTSDNWYGTIPATTVYYPARLERAGRLLAKDLGIARVLPAVAPMNMDRLTLILTADFA